VRDAAGDDVAVLAAAAAGDPVGVRRLLDEAGPVLYGFVIARVGGDADAAEDIVQETILEAVRSAASFRGDSTVTTWLCAIARHRLSRHWAGERRQERARSGLRAMHGPGPAAEAEDGGDLEAVERREQLLGALARLPAMQRQVLILKYLDGRSVQEISAEVGRSSVQVQSLLQRGRDGLRRHLGMERDGR